MSSRNTAMSSASEGLCLGASGPAAAGLSPAVRAALENAPLRSPSPLPSPAGPPAISMIGAPSLKITSRESLPLWPPGVPRGRMHGGRRPWGGQAFAHRGINAGKPLFRSLVRGQLHHLCGQRQHVTVGEEASGNDASGTSLSRGGELGSISIEISPSSAWLMDHCATTGDAP
jgi:hypothetical protein